MDATLQLKIAGTHIRLSSDKNSRLFRGLLKKPALPISLRNFVYRGKRRPDISVRIRTVDKAPTAYAFSAPQKNLYSCCAESLWQLHKKGNAYVYTVTSAVMDGKKLVGCRHKIMAAHRSYSKADIFIIFPKGFERSWGLSWFNLDFLQVLLINYLGIRGKGVVMHACGLQDPSGSGMLFSGKSGAGKSTMGSLWQEHRKAKILNDDRVILRKMRGTHYMFGLPWHNTRFGIQGHAGPVPLKNIFFIYHSPDNTARQLTPRKSIEALSTHSLFNHQRNKKCQERIAAFFRNIVKKIPCFTLGFVNNKSAVDFLNASKAHKLRR